MKVLLHHIVAAAWHGYDPCGEDRQEVHHADGNPANNAPGNLQVMNRADHKRAEAKRKAEAFHRRMTGSGTLPHQEPAPHRRKRRRQQPALLMLD